MSSSDQGHQKYRVPQFSAPPTPPTSVAVDWRPRYRRWATWAVIAYSVLLVLVAVVVCFGPGWFWPGILFLYGPRWILALPWFGLLGLMMWLRPRLLALLAIDLGLLLIPIMGVCIPWRAALHGAAARGRLRVVTCNVGHGPRDREGFIRWIHQVRADFVVLQDSDEGIAPLFAPTDGWSFRNFGEIALASRLPIREVEAIGPASGVERSSAVRFDIDTEHGPLLVVGLHLMTMRDALDLIKAHRLEGFSAFSSFAARHRQESAAVADWALARGGTFVVAGDFNMPVESPTYRAKWADFSNAFSEAGLGLGTTFASHRVGLRIDHVLSRGHWRPTRAEVGPEVGSDHRPVFAELAWYEP